MPRRSAGRTAESPPRFIDDAATENLQRWSGIMLACSQKLHTAALYSRQSPASRCTSNNSKMVKRRHSASPARFINDATTENLQRWTWPMLACSQKLHTAALYTRAPNASQLSSCGSRMVPGRPYESSIHSCMTAQQKFCQGGVGFAIKGQCSCTQLLTL